MRTEEDKSYPWFSTNETHCKPMLTRTTFDIHQKYEQYFADVELEYFVLFENFGLYYLGLEFYWEYIASVRIQSLKFIGC